MIWKKKRAKITDYYSQSKLKSHVHMYRRYFKLDNSFMKISRDTKYNYCTLYFDNLIKRKLRVHLELDLKKTNKKTDNTCNDPIYKT